MSRRWRFFWLVLLAVLLVGGIERLSPRQSDPHWQASEESPATHQARADATSPKGTRLVPLYPVGDIYVEKPKPKAEPKKEPPRKNPPRNSPPKPSFDGDRPVLEVGYDSIGFERYLEVIERVGRFFVLIDGVDGVKLGPEVSLRHGTLNRMENVDADHLASERPHLVSDPRIQERLATIGVPSDAYDDSVVLMLTRPFDSVLWDVIGETLARRGLALEEVAEIDGAYVEGGNGVFLRLDAAIAKADQRRVPLGRRLRISL
jgi:hypothetical protein